MKKIRKALSLIGFWVSAEIVGIVAGLILVNIILVKSGSPPTWPIPEVKTYFARTADQRSGVFEPATSKTAVMPVCAGRPK